MHLDDLRNLDDEDIEYTRDDDPETLSTGKILGMSKLELAFVVIFILINISLLTVILSSR